MHLQAQNAPAALPSRPEGPTASAFGSWLARASLGRPSLRRRLVRHARRILLRMVPAPWRGEYFGRRLLFPPHHDLVELTNDLPLFNTPLRRLAETIRSIDGSLRLLDIGANVGEGIPLVNPQPGDSFWLVEGSEVFLPFLRANVVQIPGVTLFPWYLADQPSHARGAEVVVAGNAHIDTTAEGSLTFETLDRLFPAEAVTAPNLLKIDVEGHEPRVFAGGRALLQKVQPVVFIEWYPKLLRQEGFDVFASLDALIAAGYDAAVVYDNHGVLFGECRLDDRKLLRQLAQYGQVRELFYFDLAVFAPAHQPIFQTFLRTESDLYAQLAHPPHSPVA